MVVCRASQRAVTRRQDSESWHSFSFGAHYDAANTGFGLLVAHNEERVAPGGGFSTHAHRDLEIITWVLDGALSHEDSDGNRGLVTPGWAQRLSAGSGVSHSEINASDEVAVRFVQMWVLPDSYGEPPSYEQRDLTGQLDRGGLVPVASGQGHRGAVSIRQEQAVLWAARLGAGEAVVVPDAPYVHVFVTGGAGALEGAGRLDVGDAARLQAAGGREFVAAEATDLLIWELRR